jgi:prolyl oligopeptidase
MTREVPDPHRWLEDGDAADVRAWTEAQNARTGEALRAMGGGDLLRARLRELLEIGFVMGPAVRTTREGTRRYFHQKREGKQDQPVLYVRDGVGGADRPLVDPGALAGDSTTAVDWWHPSHDGALVAWGRSESGSEESTLYVRDVVTGKDLADRIPETRHASVAWLPDGRSFYYTRYPRAGSVPAGDEKYFCRVYRHVLGDDPARDALVFGEGRDKIDVPSVEVSPNGRWLVVRVHRGWQKSEIFVRELSRGEEAPFVPIVTGEDALFEPIALDDCLYVRTNHDASRYRLFAVDYTRPGREAWREIVPETDDVLADALVIDRTIVLVYMHEAATRLERVDLEGRPLGAIELPAISTAMVSGAKDGDEAFLSLTSFVMPPEVLRFDLTTGKAESWDRVGARFAPRGVAVRRLYATSKDGTRIPMFLVEKEGTPRDGRAPAILYGYGGFNINQTPAFSVRALTAVERGCVWVSAILRGGGEFGEEWHRAGMRDKKQNVFDDFIACAEKLVEEKVTTPGRLAIIGGSNGGLLVAAATVQRPELFRVGVSLVPLTDMLRYHLFRIGKLWIPEYGDPDDPEDFPFLHAYSPYHHVRDGESYPSMMFATAESDSRVDPMHARKMAARMQEAQGAKGRPILLRVESKAGHGAGKPVSKLVDEMADELVFLFHELGAKVPPLSK